MESNKEEAEKCYFIAQKACMAGNTTKAIRFLNKSLKLYPSDKAKKMLSRLESEDPHEQNSEAKLNGDSESSRSMPDMSTLHGTNRNVPNYTPAQKALTDRINKCEEYYEILGVTKEATDTELKKAYRKMALQLHPDKNLAPGATDAFKAVGKAFAVLSDAEKRRQYDLYGPEGVNNRMRRRHSSSDGYEDTEAFDPQELFNMFFGGGFPADNVRVFRNGNTYYYGRRGGYRQRNSGEHQHNNRQQHNQLGGMIQLLPIFIFLIITLLGNFLSSDPVYVLTRKGDYVNQKQTANLNIQYYVKADFDASYKKNSISRRRVEEMVESDFIENLRNTCYHERVNRENLRRKGIYFGNSDMVKRAEDMSTPSCDKLEKIFNRRP